MVASVLVINALRAPIDSDPVADRHMRTRSVVDACHGAVVFWSKENKRAPTTAEGLAVLGMKQAVPRDGYDRPLVYRHDAAGPPLQFVLYSLGVNGIDEHGGGDDVSH
jgi:hypothetical protein